MNQIVNYDSNSEDKIKLGLLLNLDSDNDFSFWLNNHIDFQLKLTNFQFKLTNFQLKWTNFQLKWTNFNLFSIIIDTFLIKMSNLGWFLSKEIKKTGWFSSNIDLFVSFWSNGCIFNLLQMSLIHFVTTNWIPLTILEWIFWYNPIGLRFGSI